jgi:hypothetical protein
MRVGVCTRVKGPKRTSENLHETQGLQECEWVFTHDSKVPGMRIRIKGLESISKNPHDSQRFRECEHK